MLIIFLFFYVIRTQTIEVLQNQVKLQPSPIIINGGSLPALHIFHQPLWLPSIVRNTIDDFQQINDLQKLSDQIDIQMQNPNQGNQPAPKYQDFQKNIDSQNYTYEYKGKLQVNKETGQLFDQRFLQKDIIQDIETKNISIKIIYQAEIQIPENKTSLCENFQGFLKVRDLNENKTQDFFTILTNKRFTFYLSQDDKSSIQNSMEINKFKMPISSIPNLPRCFQVQTPNKYVNIIACAETPEKSTEWANRIQTNIINCEVTPLKI